MWERIETSYSSTKLFPVNTGTLFPADAYLCRVPCVRSIEKLIKLKESLCKEERDLREKIIEMGHIFPTKKLLDNNFWCSLSSEYPSVLVASATAA